MSININLKLYHPEYNNKILKKSIVNIIDNNKLCAIATVNEKNNSHIHTAYYSYDDKMNIYFISPLTDKHSENIKANPSVAISVWNEGDKWGEDLQGIQMYGNATVLSAGMNLIRGMSSYVQKHPDFSKIIVKPGEFKSGVLSRMFMINVYAIKLLDELEFGRRNYINVDIK